MEKKKTEACKKNFSFKFGLLVLGVIFGTLIVLFFSDAVLAKDLLSQPMPLPKKRPDFLSYMYFFPEEYAKILQMDLKPAEYLFRVIKLSSREQNALVHYLINEQFDVIDREFLNDQWLKFLENETENKKKGAIGDLLKPIPVYKFLLFIYSYNRMKEELVIVNVDIDVNIDIG